MWLTIMERGDVVFWIVAVSVFAGMMLGTCLGVLVLSLTVASSRAGNQV